MTSSMPWYIKSYILFGLYNKTNDIIRRLGKNIII